MEGQRNLCDIVEIPDYDYDCLKFNFQLGNSSKTIDLGNLECLVVTEDITEQAGVKTGHPAFDTLKIEMRETAKGYMTSMGLAKEGEGNEGMAVEYERIAMYYIVCLVL